jgi:hypothetical protein
LIPAELSSSGRTNTPTPELPKADSAGGAGGFAVSLPVVTALVVFAATLGWAHHLLFDPDIYLHVAVGRWIVEHRTVPHADVFSYSMAGAPWVVHEWLAEVAMAMLRDYLGWAGLVVMAAACVAAAAGLLQRALMQYLEPVYALIGTATAVGLCFPHLLARPHAFSLPLLAAWTAILVAAAAQRRTPPLAACLLIALWANLHSGYIIGLFIAGLFALEALIDATDRREALRAVRGWAIFGAAAVAASLATPNGIAGLRLPFDLIGMNFGLSFIGEWQSPNFQHAQPLEPWLMLLLLGALTLGARIPVTRIAMLLVFLHLALQHQRLTEVLGIVAPLILAPALAPQLKSAVTSIVDRCLAGFARRSNAGGITAAGLAALLLSAATLRIGVANDEGVFAPRTALRAAMARHPAGHVFNDINFGDYLSYSGAAAPFIDGRIDMYGDALLKRYAMPAEFPKLVGDYDIGWALLTPNNIHIPLLDSLSGWQRVYADSYAVVYLRQAQPSAH